MPDQPSPDRRLAERPFIKICGLTRVADAELAHEAGADVLGAILSPGYGRSIAPALAAQFVEHTGLPLVAVTVDAPVDDLLRWADEAQASVLQLHGNESPDHLARLRQSRPWTLWKAVRVRSAEQVEQALRDYAEVADGLLLDGWHPDQAGGAGVTFSWHHVAPLRDQFPTGFQLIAAGGLRPDNVATAVQHLRPDGVDVSSGVESALGIKDPERLRAFIAEARAARALRSDP